MCCQGDELFLNLGWTLFVPNFSPGYNLGYVTIYGSSLYISVANSNTTIPAQPGSLWAITTVAALIGGASGLQFTWPMWVSGGGAGIAGAYNINQAVTYNGGNYISLTDNNIIAPGSGLDWQSFAMNEPG